MADPAGRPCGGQCASGELPAKTTSYKQWAELLQVYARGEQLQQEMGYWRGVARAAGEWEDGGRARQA